MIVWAARATALACPGTACGVSSRNQAVRTELNRRRRQDERKGTRGAQKNKSFSRGLSHFTPHLLEANRDRPGSEALLMFQRDTSAVITPACRPAFHACVTRAMVTPDRKHKKPRSEKRGSVCPITFRSN